MSDIFEKAKELGELIKESDALKNFKEAESAQLEDKNAVELMMEYNETRQSLNKRASDPNITKEDFEKIQLEAQNAFNKIMTNENIAKYVASQQEFSNMMNQINSILSYYVSGEKEDGCGGSCSSCAGCH